MKRTIRVKVTARPVGNSIRVQSSVSNGSSTRTTTKVIRPK